jgi:Dyp-type peroxidase family
VSMSSELQEGIYYRSKPPIGNSFCVISLRAENVTQISEIGFAAARLWKILLKLKKGMTEDLNIDSKHRKSGNLTVLVAYGSELFKIAGSQKERPANFSDTWNFKPPAFEGGGEILEGAGLTYSTKIFSNHLLRDHVLLQFIADNEFFTNRAVVEVWKELLRLGKNRGSPPLRITGLYTGFQRADHRNWLGFHDGVSNMNSSERPYVISINSQNLPPEDNWTLNGTYLAFIRIAINFEKWEYTPTAEQEILIGRDKMTGCPLIGVDKNGMPLKDNRCPVPGTSEIIDVGNEYFREHPPYGIGTKDKILQYSHIGRARPIDRVPLRDKRSLRIYRQGFEFLEASSDYSDLVAGLNFVSFQNSPERVFRALSYRPITSQDAPSTGALPNLDRFMSVLAAGLFFVPPKVQGELFPGAQIFFGDRELWNLSKNHQEGY